MADKKYTVIFNDNYFHDRQFTAGESAELNEEQYQTAKKLTCGFDSNRPLVTDVTARLDSQVKPASKDIKANA